MNSAGPDLNLRKDSPRYIQNCVADLAFHENIRNDNDLYNTLFNFDEQQLTQPGLQTFTNAPFSNHPTWKDEKAALTLGYIRMYSPPLVYFCNHFCSAAARN